MGLTQADLSRNVNVTRQTIISIEKARLNPSIFLCLRLAEALHCTINDLFYLDIDMQKNSRAQGASADATALPLAQNG